MHNLAAALTQMTPAASHHTVPIMATHAQHAPPYTEAAPRHSVFPVQQQHFEGGIPSGGEMVSVAGRGMKYNDRRNSFEPGLR